MVDLRRTPPKDSPLEVHEQYLSDFLEAMDDGLDAVRAVVNGGPANVDALDGYAQALEALHARMVGSAWVEPTEDDVRNARHLVQLVREGAPSEALVEPARCAVRVVMDPWELERFQSALYCLEDDASRVQHLERIVEVLDLTLAFFERGCRVAGFVPTPVDIANVRRLREIAATDGVEVLAERLRLVKELEARLPPGFTIDPVEPEYAAKRLYVDG